MAAKNDKLPIIGKPQFMFHPIVIYLLGYMLWFFVPPFFSDGHNWHIIYLDQIALVFLIIGVSVSQQVTKAIFSRTTLRNNVSIKSYYLWLISFAIVLYGLRAYQFLQEGVVSVLHSYAGSGHIYVSIKSALSLPFVLLLWFGILAFKQKRNLLVLLLELIYNLPSGSKSRIAFIFISGIIMFCYVYGLSYKGYLKVTGIMMCMTVSLVIYSALTHNIRTKAIGQRFDKIEMTNIFEADYTTAAKRLGARFNLHRTWRLMDGHESTAAHLELLAMRGLWNRITFKTDDIEHGPGITKSLKSTIYGRVDSKSALVWPHNVILYNISGLGILGISTFHLFLGAISGSLYSLLFRRNTFNCLFVVIYIPFAVRFLLKTNSNITAILFQMILYGITILLPIIVFCLVNILLQKRL